MGGLLDENDSEGRQSKVMPGIGLVRHGLGPDVTNLGGSQQARNQG